MGRDTVLSPRVGDSVTANTVSPGIVVAANRQFSIVYFNDSAIYLTSNFRLCVDGRAPLSAFLRAYRMYRRTTR